MDKWVGRVALVTGASSGIGYGIAETLTKNGMIVIGIARNIEKIQALSDDLESSGCKGKLHPMKCDISNEEAIKDTFEAIKRLYGGVDVCVNNAGISHNASILNGVTSEWKEMMEVNILAPCVLTREFMKQMKERDVDDGHIIFINSLIGHHVFNTNFLHFYTATKFALTAIVEGVRQELREMKSQCRVTSISPGMVISEFLQRLCKNDVEMITEMRKSFVGMKYPDGEVLTAGDIGDIVVFVLGAPPRMEVNEVMVRPTSEII
jgi:NADP-dependent 3-hydroxy acid dehydrogenase YdfG